MTIQKDAPLQEPMTDVDQLNCSGCGCSKALCLEYRLNGQACCQDCKHLPASQKDAPLPLERIYGGVLSKPFWERVNAFRDDTEAHDTLYMLGCALQDIEGRMLQLLEIYESRRQSNG